MTSPVRMGRCGVAVLALCFGVGASDAALAGERQAIPQTSSEANTDNLGSAVVAPLRDINVVRSKIPDLLTKAVADPYAPPPMGCKPLKAEIAKLDAVLGDDYDDPKDDGKNDPESGGMSKPVLGVVASTITDVIPMRGWVRRLTGAERHDQMVREAIKAGFVRRGYLKGLQNAGACNGDRLVFVAAKAAPKPVFVAADPVPPPAPVQVAAPSVPPPAPAVPAPGSIPFGPAQPPLNVVAVSDTVGRP
ncbi:hypothetical protein [Caulobacter sp.]|uniref:hypothetical protein n=1 Tax=Caulobacter sp. TaxID=78 RepID=UPI0031DAA596